MMTVTKDTMAPIDRRLGLLPHYPIEDNWSCKRSGDCCKIPSHVGMTTQERDLLLEWARANWTIKQLNTLTFEETADERFVELVAKPCPFLDESSGKPICSVRPIRPYNCRRFGCLRPDPSSEPFRLGKLPDFVPYPNLANVNMRMRIIQSAKMRKLYALLQRKAQRWGRKVGWSEAM